MTLPNDMARCCGEAEGVICNKRQECARYVQRFQGGPMTATFTWLCPTPDDYHGRFIPQEDAE